MDTRSPGYIPWRAAWSWRRWRRRRSFSVSEPRQRQRDRWSQRIHRYRTRFLWRNAWKRGHFSDEFPDHPDARHAVRRVLWIGGLGRYEYRSDQPGAAWQQYYIHA